MNKIKPTLSKGTRDFLPSEVAKRNYIFDTIKSVFRKYGFEQIETPAIERLETLTGKYGEEGDKLLFKILNSGDYLKDIPADVLATGNSQLATKSIAEKGLRYDLTVPLARYVVQHQEEITFPFKRFHIGPVWRADRPQKGRYQEFYQCDADVIGSNSLLNEVELTMIYAEVFEKLKIETIIYYNHRGVFDAIGDMLKLGHRLMDFTIIIDKLDKIGWEGVQKELQNKLGLSQQELNFIANELHGKIFYQSWFKSTNCGKLTYESLSDYERILNQQLGFPTAELKYGTHVTLQYNPTLARGLSYYTGLIWEVITNWKTEDSRYENIKLGSIASGGRYDNLTEMFGGQNLSGVGISFGIERIYDVMEELNLFPASISQGVKVLFVPRDKTTEDFAFTLTQKIRDTGMSAEIFLGNVKKQKQFNYAEQKGIQYIVEIGGDEVSSGKFRLRNVKEKREDAGGLTEDDLIQKLSEN
jgi:histidyl-tRNA synthetase